jgi:hypothetical protein
MYRSIRRLMPRTTITNRPKQYTTEKECVFVVDNSYGLVQKMMKEANRIEMEYALLDYPAVPMSKHSVPSKFARQLMHPKSNHAVSQYAYYHYNHSAAEFDKLPIHFLPAETYVKTSPLTKEKTHDLIVWPRRHVETNVCESSIPQMVKKCANMEDLCSVGTPQTGAQIEFFCDVDTIQQCVLLLNWFEYCFELSWATQPVASYTFICDTIETNQYGQVSISYPLSGGEIKRIDCEYGMTYHQVHHIAHQITSKGSKK